MVWIRPTAQEVNKLEELGNPGWNWEVLEPVSHLEVNHTEIRHLLTAVHST